MNAVTPKPIPQAALLIFTLISSLFCHHKSNHKGHTQKIHAWPWPCLGQQELWLLSVQGHAHPQTEGTHMLHQQKGISGKQTSWRGPGLFKALNNTGRGGGRSRLLPSPPHPSIYHLPIQKPSSNTTCSTKYFHERQNEWRLSPPRACSGHVPRVQWFPSPGYAFVPATLRDKRWQLLQDETLAPGLPWRINSHIVWLPLFSLCKCSCISLLLGKEDWKHWL